MRSVSGLDVRSADVESEPRLSHLRCNIGLACCWHAVDFGEINDTDPADFGEISDTEEASDRVGSIIRSTCSRHTNKIDTPLGWLGGRLP